MNSKTEKRVKELRGKGIDVWSISRLNTYDNCPYGYYKTYIDKDRGKDNIYSFAGSEIHDVIEGIYNDNATKEDLKLTYEGIIAKSKAFGIKFPNENIENNWRGDMEHFVNNFVKMNEDMITEKHFLIEIREDIWIQGYIDAIYKNEDGSLTVLDWKTSSKFTGQGLIDAGRQLLLYKLALEKEGYKVDKIAWSMLKYVYVSYGNRKSMRQRRSWVKDTKNPIVRALIKHGEEDFVAELMFEEASKNNNLDNLPKEVQEQFKLEDCILEYDVTDERVEELYNYIDDIVESIGNNKEWNPVEINRSTEFFCNVLCNHRDTCKYLKLYRGEKINELDPKVEKELLDLFN